MCAPFQKDEIDISRILLCTGDCCKKSGCAAANNDNPALHGH
jgi:hypothetical protein